KTADEVSLVQQNTCPRSRFVKTVRNIVGFLILMIGMFPLIAQAQPPGKDLAGIWTGALDVNTIKLRLVFEVTRKGDALSAILKSIDQGGQPIPCSAATFTGGNAHIGVVV